MVLRQRPADFSELSAVLIDPLLIVHDLPARGGNGGHGTSFNAETQSNGGQRRITTRPAAAIGRADNPNVTLRCSVSLRLCVKARSVSSVPSSRLAISLAIRS